MQLNRDVLVKRRGSAEERTVQESAGESEQECKRSRGQESAREHRKAYYIFQKRLGFDLLLSCFIGIV